MNINLLSLSKSGHACQLTMEDQTVRTPTQHYENLTNDKPRFTSAKEARSPMKRSRRA